MFKLPCLLLLLLLLPSLAARPADPEAPAAIDGRWRVKDRNKDRDTAIIEIRTSEGQGRLDPFETAADARCPACTGALAGAPMHGLPLLQDLHVEGGLWQGRILDPDTGRSYAVELVKQGASLHITARAVFGLFWHREVWLQDAAQRP